MIRAAALALLVLVLAGPGFGDVITNSPRPLPRPWAVQAAPVAAPQVVTAAKGQSSLRPRPRPFAPSAAPQVQPLDAALAGLAPGPGDAPRTSLRPLPRPGVGYAAALPVPEPEPVPQQSPAPGKKGSVCGNPAIKGEKLARIKGKVKGCGIENPVRVTQVAGIKLSTPATLSCETAEALHSWIEGAMRPAFGRREVVELQIAASYVCRTRNNKRGAKISEHGRGKAIDISGFTFADGSHWSVLRDYNKQMRKAHRGACGIFGTTLGPGSDGFHEDHLHFDVARHGSGAYCR